jgi:hypothetical protein
MEPIYQKKSLKKKKVERNEKLEMEVSIKFTFEKFLGGSTKNAKD